MVESVTNGNSLNLTHASNRKRLIRRGLIIWLVLMMAEVVHGIVRGLTLVSWVGQFRSNQIGVLSGSAIILVISYFTIGWIGARQRADLLRIGGLWLVLTLAFEMSFGRFAIGLTWEQLLADYNLSGGGLMPIGLLVLLLSPLMAAKLRTYQNKSFAGDKSRSMGP